jgi:hypothetical protein
MTIKTSDKTFRQLTRHTMSGSSFIRMFNILIDHDRHTKFMNIFRSYKFNEDLSVNVTFYDTYEVGHEEWWDNISVKYYGTPSFWWVIPAFNDIVNPFETLEPGTNLKILKSKYIYSLMRDLDSIASMG